MGSDARYGELIGARSGLRFGRGDWKRQLPNL
jgi:hypothetical protein